MKNYYIPSFYTKAWAGEDGKLTVYTRPHRNVVERSRFPTQVGYQTDLYTLPGVSDFTKDVLEVEFFRVLDQRAYVVLKKMEAAVQLSVDEREVWVTFMISLRQRNPQKVA